LEIKYSNREKPLEYQELPKNWWINCSNFWAFIL